MFAEHTHDGGRGRVPALLRAAGDDESGGNVAQAEVLLAQVQGHGQHGVVGGSGAADGFATAAGGFVAFQGCRTGLMQLIGALEFGSTTTVHAPMMQGPAPIKR
ncbi:hypothetical protein [Nonomuraea dietziae]|uniref:hypothetical protein n=1 Tax=Nonomuraea dietziae TaxID=65515 RepID=UPI00340FC1B2